MQSTFMLKHARWSLPCSFVLAFVAGCGGDGSTAATSASTGATSTGTGAGGSGSGGAASTSTGMGTSAGGGSTGTGLAMTGPPVPVDAPVYHETPDVMTPIMPGVQAGYGISTDGQGTFQLIWTGNTTPGNPAVAFTGSVWTTGKFTMVARGCTNLMCGLEMEDVVSPTDGAMGGGEHIAFTATSTNDLDGFEFIVDKEPVYFDLKYDGQSQTGRVIYVDSDKGGSPANPQKMPFGIMAQ